jgi:hypothetical protein
MWSRVRGAVVTNKCYMRYKRLLLLLLLLLLLASCIAFVWWPICGPGHCYFMVADVRDLQQAADVISLPLLLLLLQEAGSYDVVFSNWCCSVITSCAAAAAAAARGWFV